jgi:predicted nucleotidyltransferase
MSDDTIYRGLQDHSRVAMNDDYKVAFWTRKFRVSREHLQEAVDAVGENATAVEEYLRC